MTGESEEPDARPARLQEATLSTLELLRDEVVGLFERRADMPGEVDKTLRNLFSYMAERGQAVSFLVSWGYGWDAEIVLRTYYEVAARILFFCFSEAGEREELLREFWSDLGAIGDRRRALKAAFASSAIKAATGKDDRVISALQDPAVFETEARANKVERSRIERKWSFAQIVLALSRRRLPGQRLDLMTSLLHNYGVASHLIHGDRTALDLMRDRATRDPSEAMVVSKAHVARIMSDQVGLAYMCADAFRGMCGLEFARPDRLHTAYGAVLQLQGELAAEFEASQEEFYEGGASGQGT